jgi:hypothetical protein
MQLKEGKEEVNNSYHPNLYPKKMILKHGAKHFLLATSDIVYCYSNNKVVYIVDGANQKYVYDKNLLRLTWILTSFSKSIVRTLSTSTSFVLL